MSVGLCSHEDNNVDKTNLTVISVWKEMNTRSTIGSLETAILKLKTLLEVKKGCAVDTNITCECESRD